MSTDHQVLGCKTCTKTFTIEEAYAFAKHVNECSKNQDLTTAKIEEHNMLPKEDLHNEIKAMEHEMLNR